MTSHAEQSFFLANSIIQCFLKIKEITWDQAKSKFLESRSLIRLMFLFRKFVIRKVSWCKLDVKMSKKEFYTMKCHKKTATFLSYCGTNHQGDLFGVYLVPKICHYLSLLVSHWLPFLCVELAKLCSFPISIRVCFDFERIRDRFFPSILSPNQDYNETFISKLIEKEM